MDLSSLVAWSQVLGVLGTLGSLIYLAIQLKANTTAVRTQNVHNVINSFNSVNLLVASDPQLADLFTRGLADYDGLHATEKTRFSFMCLSAFRVYDALYLHVQRGTGEKELWESEVPTLRWLVSEPGLRRWWHQQKFAFSPGFREFTEAQMPPTPMADSPP